MAIVLRSDEEIEAIRKAGIITAAVLKHLKERAAPGVKTETLDRIARNEILRRGGIPAFKGYRGFPAHICTSINDVIVHGIPSPRQLKDGDILSIDVGVRYGAYCADAAITVGIGTVSDEAQRLMAVTEQALAAGIAQAAVGNRLTDISSSIQGLVEANGFSIVRAFVGHGIGTKVHEDPEVPNFGSPGKGPRLEAGMVLAIEPMVNAGTYEAEILDDGWAAVTKDRRLSAHFEHTIVIRKGGPEIMTQLERSGV